MKSFLRLLALLILFVNGFAALYGGSSFMVDPDGKTLNMPVSMLQGSPFHDYFIPGIILFVANGICSLVVATLTIYHMKWYKFLLIMQGSILTIWIIVQINMIHTFNWLQITLLSMGLTLLAIGIILLVMKRFSSQKS
jgi:hypothetical protein